MRVRAAALLIQNDSIAVMERHRGGMHYFVFPGGGVDEGETAEQAVIRETREELGVDVRVMRPAAEGWFNGNRQAYFLVEQTGGEFGTGAGPEFNKPFDPMHGTYRPMWAPITELNAINLLPREVAELVMRRHAAGWPEEAVTIVKAPQ